MPTMNMIQALNSAMDVMLERDPKTVIFGEDVGYFGGVFNATDICWDRRSWSDYLPGR